MKKILVIIAVLSLIAGTAYAAALDDGLTREVFAQNKGQSVATDSSVILKLWAGGGGAVAPGVGVSSSSIIKVYTNYKTGTGVTIDTANASFDTIGEIVDYINTNLSSDSSVLINASVGRDGRRSTSSQQLTTADVIAMGYTKSSTTATVKKQSNDRISAGAEGVDNKINRIKSYTCQWPGRVSSPGITFTIYDGDTATWRNYVPNNALITATAISASPNTVELTADGKGIAASLGNSIMIDAVADATGTAMSVAEKTQVNLSIVYDQF